MQRNKDTVKCPVWKSQDLKRAIQTLIMCFCCFERFFLAAQSPWAKCCRKLAGVSTSRRCLTCFCWPLRDLRLNAVGNRQVRCLKALWFVKKVSQRKMCWWTNLQLDIRRRRETQTSWWWCSSSSDTYYRSSAPGTCQIHCYVSEFRTLELKKCSSNTYCSE